GTVGRNVIVKWLEIAAATSGDKKYAEQLVSFTSNSYEFITRTNSMAALRKLNYFEGTALNNCMEACLSSNGRLAGPAAETLKYFYGQAKHKKQIYDAVKGKEWKGWEKDILVKLIQ
ncbi:MAG: hypothetical protein ACXVP0_15685, partial [Bacteroidia bacterium]